jgi:pimeloyl-ACP methyl ester carboxylesterase
MARASDQARTTISHLVDAVRAQGEPLFVVGHSMGGTVAALYAGTFPEAPTKLVVLEGLGPPDNPPEVAPLRFRRWIDEVRVTRARAATRLGTREDALERLAANHAYVDRAILRDRLAHLVRELPGGGLGWKNDPLHRTTSPMPFFASTFKAFLARVTCPALYVDGGPLGYHPPDEDDRLACLAKLERRTIEGAGHMMHWTRPHELAEILVSFLSSSVTRAPA